VKGWTVQLECLLRDYDAKDIFVADETGLCFKLLPEYTMSFKGNDCSGGEKAQKEYQSWLVPIWVEVRSYNSW
jgi:hypothetical protein